MEEVNPNYKLEAEGLYAYNNYTKTSIISWIIFYQSMVSLPGLRLLEKSFFPSSNTSPLIFG